MTETPEGTPLSDLQKAATAMRKEQVESLPRPDQIAGLDSRAIQERARHETADTCRVYRKEWLIDRTFTHEDEAAKYLSEKYDGRLEPDDMKVMQLGVARWAAMTNKWNITSEWKTRELADQHADELHKEGPSDIRVVTRNSRDDHMLQEYGVKKLVRPGAQKAT